LAFDTFLNASAGNRRFVYGNHDFINAFGQPRTWVSPRLLRAAIRYTV